jgi:hypothetical protein
MCIRVQLATKPGWFVPDARRFHDAPPVYNGLQGREVARQHHVSMVAND